MVYSYWAIDPNVTFPQMWFQFAEDTPAKHDSHKSASSPGTGISNLFYGFPTVPWGPPNVARIAVDSATQIIKDPEFRTPTEISPSDLENTLQFVSRHIKGIGPSPVPVFSGQALQTNVYDNMFVLDYIPDDLMRDAGPERSKSIAVFTAGWAMKFVPLIGTVLKEMLVDGGTTDYDISQFKMERRGTKPEQYIVQEGGPRRDGARAHAASAELAPASSYHI